ncbi:MAG TPA: ergothioneine biosynthesis protein EgtB [Caulobacteraceae bacterium]|nr:ergothioneine biosynthesis protein EgtB [Caulobacteraceae bacterium]
MSARRADDTRAAAASELARRYATVRSSTLALTTPLSAEDQAAQSMPDTSPIKWHQAHTSWFFETFLLIPRLEGYEPFDPLFGYLFNSYYESQGPRRPRPARGLVTRPSLSEVRAYRRHVDEAMATLLSGLAAYDPAVRELVELGLAHEEQHQELILMDVLHLFAQMPGYPAYRSLESAPAADPGPLGWIDFTGGEVEIGAEAEGFSFDNERPRHRVWLEPYLLADRLVTNGEWLAFMAADGYGRPEFWLSDGWTAVQTDGWRSPLYWVEAEDGHWREMTLGGLKAVDLHAPVSHVSYYEADAYARWAGARLPTEAEWENASAGLDPAAGALDLERLAPRGAGNGRGLRQMFGELWQWTASPYAPYPGFRPDAGAVGEYNGKFMVNQMVLRGGCCATPQGHVRAAYRNFFYAHQRWPFSGVRLAQDASGRRSKGPVDARLLGDVIDGLSASPKTLPSKYLYDERGSALFEAICQLPEYYPTRTETALLAGAASEIARHISDGAALIEFGSGASVKTRLLLEAATQLAVYIPMDISPDALDQASAAIRAGYPRLEVAPLVGDFTQPIDLPEAARGRARTGFFPGSTIGNFPPDEAVEFLKSVRRLLGGGAQFIVGADLVKDEKVLVAAYDDAQGVTAHFNLNLLTRLNRELGADFDIAGFGHRAVWNAAQSRMEMHLVSRADQVVSLAGRQIAFEAGETIHSENSYKFTPQGFADLADRAGWRVGAQWISREPEFAVFLLQDWV